MNIRLNCTWIKNWKISSWHSLEPNSIVLMCPFGFARLHWIDDFVLPTVPILRILINLCNWTGNRKRKRKKISLIFNLLMKKCWKFWNYHFCCPPHQSAAWRRLYHETLAAATQPSLVHYELVPPEAAAIMDFLQIKRDRFNFNKRKPKKKTKLSYDSEKHHEHTWDIFGWLTKFLPRKKKLVD